MIENRDGLAVTIWSVGYRGYAAVALVQALISKFH
jgi:hypothetical protein